MHFFVGDEVVSTQNNDPRPTLAGTSDTITEDHVGTGIPKTRKRSVNKSVWKATVKKVRRNCGQEYVSSSGKIVPSKTFQNIACNCKKKCAAKIKEDQRKQIFESFWKLADYSRQNVFIRGLVTAQKVARKRIRNGAGAEKQTSFKYSFRVENHSMFVCKKYFVDTLQISVGRLYRCISQDELCSVIDSRGMNPRKKLDDSKIIEHINSFPAYQSHYTRKDNPGKKYLNEELTISKMYELYKEKCISENVLPCKKKFYYHVFNTKFNLSFKPPSKDTCSLCDRLKMQIEFEDNEETKNKLKIDKKLHLAKADQARNALKSDQKKASDNIYVLTFDLQKALPFPKVATSVAYYKKNLYVYNLGVHSFNIGTGFMYMYNETEGGRGSQDVASCVVKHLKEFAANHKHIILYSDSCTGQNRNIKMSLSLLKLVQDSNMAVDTIDLKFLVSGHSFLPNDADFGIIEKFSRKCPHIFSAQDWMKIAGEAKKKEPRFRVIEMKREEFKSTKTLESAIQNRKKTVTGYGFSWLNIRWLRFERASPISLQFKETLNEDIAFETVDLSKSIRGRKISSLTIQQDQLYPSRRNVTESKKQHMKDLLPFIPPIYHNFYKNLPVEGNTRQSQANKPIGDEEELTDEPVYV